MLHTKQDVLHNLKYLKALAIQYPTEQAASTEIINLQAILNLPKGTEHFMSDLHGEYEAFLHILNNASGVIREKVDLLYEKSLPSKERAVLATLIYYPEEKLKEIKEDSADMEEWYRITLNRLIEICRLVSSKYTRSKVRKALPKDFEYIIDELLHTNYDELNKEKYYENIIETIIDIERADEFIFALCNTIKRLVVDRLHIVGDIFDRGPRADIVMDSLMEHHCVDIQWGNHDVLWMGAAAGSRTCIASVLNNSITYNNLEVVEMGYGINLRPLALFAAEVYGTKDVSCFRPKLQSAQYCNPKDIRLVACMHKAIAVIQFKLEGQIIQRNPGFNMDDRLLLDKIDYEHKTVRIGNKDYKLRDCDFPTVNRENPYELTDEETLLMEQLKFAFRHSEKLQKHVRFLYAKGGLYKCYNGNLLFHGCIPMNTDGSFMEFECDGERLSGRAFMDYTESLARQAFTANAHSPEKLRGKDFMWFLWCGRNSPLFGRDKITTFERLLVDDKTVWEEPKNPYYVHSATEEACVRMLKEFELDYPHSHIINGHVPVRSKDGETPVKANGRLIVIDGGFCRAYQPTTGIAGYTLVFNSYGIRIISHEPFDGARNAIRKNKDILSTSQIYETMQSRIKVSGTDEGQVIKENIEGLRLLLSAYRIGVLKEQHNK
ncbi:fructose-1,6-bisphosphatase-3 [Hydrogenoanaerobacterium saccharovorans]|uniref:Fructose-1,6-bisphosphatase class 3 n=1 Tax=Hydrogenoanaerobacterium saccharovorans TaxID=474960 RepID=A0A1H8AAT3_9FIRM|nr:fructose-1,6-bisphosphatase [Hydrogenoanaerobacterium saccharovorans]RPF48089.1 fructose-1,6-bisphosphatase-3 [Hydrogenoanaerobacterium saccharovorans]SEM67034.1 fructose-1,6-bisphosphatase-3 [Hydrogenoanaerobacterium saccharovorans]